MNLNDRDTLIKLLDRAMSSNNESVKEMLQSLLITVSLVHADDKLTKGPLDQILTSMRDMQETMKHMQRKMSDLEDRIQRNSISTPTRSIYEEDKSWGWKKKIEEDDAWGESVKRVFKRFQADKDATAIKRQKFKESIAKSIGKNPAK